MGCHRLIPMKDESMEWITLSLPSALYQNLWRAADRQGVSLAEFLKQKVEREASSDSELALLPLNELMRRTEPKVSRLHPDSCIDFYV